jgi:2-isopropylmalate synthase
VTVRIEGTNGQHSLDAQKEVEQARTFGGHGADTDIIVASVKAYLSALNKMLVANGAYGDGERPAQVGAAMTN